MWIPMSPPSDRHRGHTTRSLLGAVLVLSLAGVAHAPVRGEGEDRCASWTLEGYRLGMTKAEALAVRPARSTGEVGLSALDDAGRFRLAKLYFTKDERLRGVFVDVFSTLGVIAHVNAGLTTVLGAEPSTPVTGGEGRLRFPGYSIQPPRGEGWIRAGSIPPGVPAHALFYKQTSRQGHTIVLKAGGQAVDPPPGTGPGTPAERLSRFVGAMELVVDSRRFEPISLTSSVDDSLGFECRRFDQVVVDRGVPDANGAAYPFENHGFVCAHPDFPDYLVSIDYSQRTPPGVEPIALKEEGEAFLRTLALDRLGVRIDSLPIGGKPETMALSHGSVWVSHHPQTVTRIDPGTRAVLAAIEVGENPLGMAATKEAVWVANQGDRSVSRIDPEGNRVVATVEAGKDPMIVETAAGSVWVSDSRGGLVTRIDPATNKVLARIRVGKGAFGLAGGGGGLFVSLFEKGTVCRIDPATNKVVSTFKVGNGPSLMLFAADQLWVANQRDRTVVRVDPATGRILATVDVGEAPVNLALYEGLIWVANAGDDTLSVIDPEDNELVGRPIPVGKHPQGLLVVGDELWVTTSWSSAIRRLTRRAPVPDEFAPR